jgi:hypothetical protein
MWPTTRAPVESYLDPRERAVVAEVRATCPPGEAVEDDTATAPAEPAKPCPRDFSSERRRLIERGLLRPASGARASDSAIDAE